MGIDLVYNEAKDRNKGLFVHMLVLNHIHSQTMAAVQVLHLVHNREYCRKLQGN